MNFLTSKRPTGIQRPHSVNRPLFQCFVGLFFVLLISACAAPPKKARLPKPVVAEAVPSQTQAPSFQSLLNKAKNAPEQDKLNYLINAADTAKQTHCQKSIIILDALQHRTLTDTQNAKSNLIWAHCLKQQHHFDKALQKLSNITVTPDIAETFYQLQAELYLAQKDWWLGANSLAKKASTQDVELWELLNKLSTPVVEEKVMEASLLTPLLQLQIIQRRMASSPTRLNASWETWRNQHPSHSFTQSPPPSLQALLASAPYSPRKLGVILPLSGRLSAQGETLKEGILAAYFAQQESSSINNDNLAQAELVFIDSQLDEASISQQLDSIDFVVGPLLKENIARLSPIITVPWLALNFTDTTGPTGTASQSQPTKENSTQALPENTSSTVPLVEAQFSPASRYYFALSPEDEGIQIAKHLHTLDYKKPLIIKASNSAAQRMAEAFKQEWQSLTQSDTPNVEEVPFTDTKSMRAGISDMLEISGSKQRIKEVEALVLKEVHTFERNRRDADAIVVFANAPQTELITPFIEANTSPFASILPVYASSRSHTSNKNLNSLRDLRNLKFLDMPWMLPENPARTLKQFSQNLWPEKRDSDQRLFAMGYDAYGLIKHLKALKLLEQYQYQGLTGDINMDEQYQLRRALEWGQIKDEKVVKLQ